jgi:hypothetical protein
MRPNSPLIRCAYRTLVIETLLEKAFSSQHEQITYFYCEKGRNTLDILRSIVRQLSFSRKAPEIEPFIKKVFQGSSKKGELDLNDCEGFIPTLFGRCKSTTVIIDALDECDDPHQLLSSLKSLSTTLHNDGVSVRCFISSRNDVPVQRLLDSCTAVSVTANLVGSDLRRFVEQYVIGVTAEEDHALSGDENSALRERIVSVLTERSEGWYVPIHPTMFFVPCGVTQN